MAHPPIVHFQDVGFTTSGNVILRNINLSLQPGEVLGVSGPNGAGKTTLLRLLAALATPTSGQYDILGLTPDTPREQKPAIQRRIAFIGHFPALWPELTLRENIELIQQLRGQEPTGDPPLQAVGLTGAHRRRAATSSLGMLRRVEFARLTTWTPRLLLLDEPHAGLDSASAGLVEIIVNRVIKAQGTAVIVSHDLPRAEAFITRRARIENGTLQPNPSKP